MMGGRAAPGRERAVETEGLTRVYRLGAQEVRALSEVDLAVDAASFVAVKGRSGSGKTTLLNCLGGLDAPTSGVARVFGRDISLLGAGELTEWRRREVGFVFQSFGLLPTLSAYENVELMPRIVGRGRRERRERTLACLGMVGLSGRAHHRMYELSGGQQQRVAIARALANRPRLVLADEPTGELDSETAREILGLFRRIVDEEALTLMVVSHDPLVDGYADRVIHLQDGRIAGGAAG